MKDDLADRIRQYRATYANFAKVWATEKHTMSKDKSPFPPADQDKSHAEENLNPVEPTDTDPVLKAAADANGKNNGETVKPDGKD